MYRLDIEALTEEQIEKLKGIFYATTNQMERYRMAGEVLPNLNAQDKRKLFTNLCRHFGWKIYENYKNLEFDKSLLMEGEEVKPYLDLYFVTSKGRIFSSYRGTIKEVAYRLERGYKKVDLSVDGRRKGFRVHRLVAELFLGKKPNGKNIVDHIDTDRMNNSVENLRCVDEEDNLQNTTTREKLKEVSVKGRSARELIEELFDLGYTDIEIIEKVISASKKRNMLNNHSLNKKG